MNVNFIPLVSKDPDAASYPFGFDWTAYLAEISVTETIATSSWAISNGDVDSAPATVLTTANDSIVTGSLKTQVQLNAGTRGMKYTLTNSIVTSSGVHDDRSMRVLIEDA